MDYEYALEALEDDGTVLVLGQTEARLGDPLAFSLEQNVPNPFNPTTTISFTLPEKARANLSIFNVEGKLVKTLVDDVMGEGLKEVTWDGFDSRGIPVSSGVYFYRLKAGKEVLTKKMVVLE